MLTTGANTNESQSGGAADPKDGVYNVKGSTCHHWYRNGLSPLEISGDQPTDGMQIITDIDRHSRRL